MIKITSDTDKVLIEFDPKLDGRIKQSKRKASVCDVIYEDMGDDTAVMLFYVDGTKTDLHWQVHFPEYLADNSIDWGIEVDTVKATSNEHLFDLLNNIF